MTKGHATSKVECARCLRMVERVILINGNTPICRPCLPKLFTGKVLWDVLDQFDRAWASVDNAIKERLQRGEKVKD